MKNQKELKEEFMNIVKTEIYPSCPDMVEYERKNTAYIVELQSGDIVALEKPRIKKDFCFGYGFYGISTIEEDNAAADMARKAEKDTDYFINENMKQITDKIENLKECFTDYMECYLFTQYSGQPEKSKLKGFSICRLSYNPEYEPGYWSNCKDLKKANTADIQALIDGLEEVKKSFEKRLNTYLKKYGLSKVNSWTYLRD